ncbi:MAG TPA: ABC transporter permease [Nitrososphaerales archaeon]|nr:ABC transporter permease [Nitrososphaerales archaeon]
MSPKSGPGSKQETKQIQPEQKKKRKRASEIRYAFSLARRNPVVLSGSIIAIVTIILTFLSGVIVQPDLWKVTVPVNQLCWNNPSFNWGISNVLVCPDSSTVHLLGTDYYGRDLLSMIVLSLPTDLEIAFAVVLSAFAIGVILGSVSAYAGGKLDETILRITDVFFAIPPLILAIVILSTRGRSLPMLALAVLITWWPIYVRLVRSQVLAEKGKPYAEALRAIGAGRLRILFFHLLPNSIYPILVQLTLDIGGVILTFSSLMFLGFSPNPLLPELGNLVSEGINYVNTAPWLIIFPGLTILIIALGFNLLGDGVRDLLDPRLRR